VATNITMSVVEMYSSKKGNKNKHQRKEQTSQLQVK
jgi:hypothetical protein